MSKDIYDVTPAEREIIEWRHKRRLELRNQYMKEAYSPRPNFEGYIFDRQVQRRYTVDYSYERIFKPTVKNFLWFATLSFGVLTVMISTGKHFRDVKEHKFRTGQVSYHDRGGKFV